MKQSSLLATLFIISVCASAQTAIIPRLGISLAKFGYTDYDFSDSHILGYVGGVAFQFRSQKRFSLQPEIYYITKGAYVDQLYSRKPGFDETSYLEEHIIRDIRVGYLEIPFLAKFSFGGKKLKVFFNLGPSIAIGLGGKYDGVYSLTTVENGVSESYPIATFKGDVSFESPSNIDEEDRTVYLGKRIDICAQLGVGFLIANKISLEARFGFALEPSNVKSAQDTYGASMAQQAYQFTAGIPLLLRRKSE